MPQHISVQSSHHCFTPFMGNYHQEYIPSLHYRLISNNIHCNIYTRSMRRNWYPQRYFEHLKAVELDGSNKASSARRPHFVSKLSKCWGSFQATFLLHYQHICRFMNPNDNLFPNITKWFCWLDPLRVPRVDGKLFWKGCKHVISKRGHPSRVFLW